jgi:hypothetical protein
VVKILIPFLIFRGSFRAAKFLTPMPSLFVRKIFLVRPKNNFLGVNILRSFVSVNSEFFCCFKYLKISKIIDFFMHILRPLCVY